MKTMAYNIEYVHFACYKTTVFIGISKLRNKRRTQSCATIITNMKKWYGVVEILLILHTHFRLKKFKITFSLRF